MYFQMNGEINAMLEQRFIDFYNQNQDMPIKIILNTAGGGYYYAESMANMINELTDVKILVQAAYSAGFMLLYNTKCKLEISRTCRGMWHFGRWQIEMNDKGKPYFGEDVCVISNMPSHSKETKKIAKGTMNENEYRRFIKDDYIYFTTKRMREIFADRL